MLPKRVLLLPLFISFMTIAGHENIYDPSRDALSDYKSALLSAKKERKNIIVITGGNWCKYCYKLEEELKESALDKIIEDDFILMKANFGDGNDNERFFNLFPKFNTYPHVMIISSEGKLLESKSSLSENEIRSLLDKYTIKTRV